MKILDFSRHKPPLVSAQSETRGGFMATNTIDCAWEDDSSRTLERFTVSRDFAGVPVVWVEAMGAKDRACCQSTRFSYFSFRPILSGQNRAEVEHEPERYVQVGLLPCYNVSGGGGVPILEPLKLFGFSKSTTDDVPEDNRSDFRVFLASWPNMNARVVLCSSHQLARWVLRVWL